MLKATYPFDYYGISDIGLVRDHNEDVWAAHPQMGVFALADGMGGHSAGEVAAKEAVDYVSQLIKKWKPTEEPTAEQMEAFLYDALIETNQWIYQKAASDEALNGMGTTLCVLFILGKVAVLGHVGDSRIYRIRNTRLTQMTEDHSLVSEMQALGVMDHEEGRSFPYKHILTRAIGSHPMVEPTVSSISIQQRDLFFLCSDGLTNFVKDEEIKEILLKNISLEKKGKELVDLANEHGGGDNVTCILVCPNDLPG